MIKIRMCWDSHDKLILELDDERLDPLVRVDLVRSDVEILISRLQEQLASKPAKGDSN
jgi:hypothetical protein